MTEDQQLPKAWSFLSGLIVARLPHLPVACVPALTLPLALSSPTFLPTFSKLCLVCYSPFLSPCVPRPPRHSALTAYGKLSAADCCDLIKGSYVAAIYRRCCEQASSCDVQALSSAPFFLSCCLFSVQTYPFRSCSGSSDCSRCQDCTVNQKALADGQICV